MNRNYLFILASGRRGGNTELLAQKAAEFLPESAGQTWLHLLDLPLPPFEDIRHPVSSYGSPEGDEKVLFDATLAATDIVIASPLYWYSLSASAKLYLDYWSAWLRAPGEDFKKRMAGKRLWVVSASSSEEDATEMSAPLVDCLRLSADYMSMDFGGVLLGRGNRVGDVLADSRAMDEAKRFFTSPFFPA